ncbi:PKD domain-containing protein [Deinococcus altitudinis]|uniref:PKD domain-containing protein n=1 Tax=Deinococcus altitudinis TaxID=468914 RepID=UPI003892A0CD
MTFSTPSGQPVSLPVPGWPVVNRASSQTGRLLALLLFLLSGLTFAQTSTPPVLIVTPASVPLRQIVTADARALDPNTVYTLDWGDNDTASLSGSATAQQIHNYRAPGTYSVMLSAPGIAPAVATVNVTFPVPTLSAIGSGLSATLNLGNLLVDYPYEINWGDGSTETSYPNSAAIQLTHLYSQPGTYVIRVTPENAPPVTTTITLSYPTPVLVLTPGRATLGQPVVADISNLEPALTTTLNWGDGATEVLTGAATAQKTHTYAQAGTYVVTVTSSGTTPVTSTVTITIPVPTASATATGLNVTLNLGNLLTDYAYTVAWGDGATQPLTPTADTAQLTHAYAQPGTAVILITPQGAAPVTTTVTLTVPGAVLSVQPASAPVGQTVTGTLSDLTPTLSYTLSWGDGATDTITGTASAQKTHAYARPGTYTVTLTSLGTTPATAVVNTSVPVPVAVATATGLTATLNLSNLLSSYVYTVTWGDGATEPLTPTTDTAQLTHNYAQPGTVTVQVMPQGGTPVTTTVTLSAPTPVLTVTPSSAAVRQTFTANLASLVSSMTYTLDWGDKTTDTVTGSATAQKTHAYAQPGTYVLTLTSPGTTPVTATVSTTVPAPVATAAATGLTATLNLSNLLSGYVYTVTWGDGATEPLTPSTDTAQLTHNYAQPGTVTIQVTPQGGTPVTTTVTLTAPNSVLTVTPSSAAIRQTVTANLASLVPALTYTLDWGDKTTDTITGASTAQKTHAYAQPGTYTVTLTATGTVPATVSVTVGVPAPVLTATSAALSATLKLSNLLSGYVYTVTWGDGATEPLTPTADTAQLTHNYAQPGTVTIQVTPQGGTPVTTTATLTAPNSVLTVTPSSAAIRQTVTASLASLVPALTYTLDWGDKTTDTITGVPTAQKTHTYAQPGTYTVTLTATGTVPATVSVTVGVPAPVLTATSAALSATLNLSNLLSGYVYTVTWGDGATAPLTPTTDTAQLIHNYAQPGTVTIQVTPQGGTPVTTTATLSAPTPVLTVTPSSAAVRQTTTANLASLVPSLTYTLDWGDKTTDTITGASTAQKTHTYAQPGTYTVILTSPGTTPVTATVSVGVPAPVLTVTSSALKATLNLSNLLSGYVYTVTWGDGSTDPLTPTADTVQLTHTYAQPGTVTIQVTPQGGAPVTSTVTLSAPTPVLSVTPGSALVRQTVTANLASLVPSLTYTLDWGDKTTETVTGMATAQKTHTYAQPGTYTVILTSPGTTPVTATVGVGVPAPVLTVTSSALKATLNLSNLLSGYVYTVAWGDGSTEPLTPTTDTAQLTHTYAQPGSFTLQVTPQGGAPVTTTATLSAPNSALTVTPSSVQVRQTVTANLMTLVPALTYTLNWGDGATETITGTTTVQKTHTYARPGTYTVSLSATGTTPATVSVTVGAPTPVLTATSSALSATLNLSNLLPDYTYTVTWGDGVTEPLTPTADTAQLIHNYAQPGTVTIQVTPQGGTPVTTTVTLIAPTPVLTVTPSSALIRQTVTANLASLVPALTYTLDWGDGAAETVTGTTTVQKTHTYARPDTYTVSLSATGTTPATVSVTVGAPTPVLTATSSALSATLNLSNLLQDYTYSVTWGDGVTEPLTPTADTAQLIHNYAQPGTVTIQVTPQGGTPVTTTATLTAPNSVLTVTPNSAAIRQTVTANLTTLVPALTYTLEWGDGAAETVTGTTTVQKSHTYARPDTYTVSLSATGTTPATVSVTIGVPAPILTATSSALSATLNLSNLLPDYTYSVTWGDGVTEPLTPTTDTAQLTHNYAQPGTVTIQVTPQGGTPVTTPVTLTAPNSVLTVTPNSAAIRQTVTANLASLVPALTYTLDWGDGVTETIAGTATAQKTHTYNQPGTYTVKLTSPATTPVTATVGVGVPAPVLTVTSSALKATLNLSNLLSGYVYTVTWGDGATEPLTPTADTAQLTHNYAQPGTVTIQVTPQGGTPVTTPVTLTAPNSVLTVTPNSAAIRQTVTASLASLVPALTYTLDWGDKTTDTVTGSTATQKTHSYSTPGAYTVTLTSSGTTPVTTAVTVNVPAPVLTVTSSALKATLNLSNLLSGYVYTVAWGDGSTEPLTPTTDTAQLTHTYAQPGSFTLQVTPQGGAPVTTTATLSAPNSALTVTPSNTLVRQTVTANLTTLVPALTYTLDWGDKTTDTITGASTAQKTHTYAQPGTYTVSLSATGTTPATVNVTVGVPAPTLTATSSALTATLNLSTLLSGYVYSVVWGDGITEPFTPTADTAQLKHTYVQRGSFTVQVTPQGGTPVTAPVNVALPTATLAVTAQRLDAAADLDLLVSGQPYTLTWGDTLTETFTATGATARVPHRYTQPGAVTVTLTAPGRMTPVTAALRLSAPPALEVGATDLTANASVSQLIVGLTYTLNWGDGTTEPLTATAAQVTLTHAYAKPGTYTVRVSLPGGDSASTPVTVTAPAAALTLTPTTAALGQQVTANLSGLAPSLPYTLAWGDGKTETLTGLSTAVRTHSYTDASTYITGTFTVTLSAPGVTPVTAVVTVSVPVPTLALTQNQLTVTATVGNMIPLASSAFSYLIDWGDGSADPFVSSGSDLPLSFVHRYARAGTFQVRVTPPAGGTPVQNSVTVGVPVPTLAVTQDVLRTTLTVGNLLRTSAETPTYRVTWGDGSSETFANPAGNPTAQLVHTYTSTGTFSVQVTPPAGGAPVFTNVTVTLPDPVLTVTPKSVQIGEPVTANVSGLEPTLSYVLSWGDDSPNETLIGQSAFQRTHTYALAGNFRLQLQSVFGFVTVTVPAPTVTATANALTVTLALGNLVPGYAYRIDWEYGVSEPFTATATAGTVTHTYKLPGKATVIVTPQGGDGVVATVILSATLPVLNVTPATLTVGGTVTADLSNLLPKTYTVSWGDGTYDTLDRGATATRTHIYTSTGTFTVTLSGEDAAPVTVTVAAPTPVMSVTPGSASVRQTVSAKISNLRGELSYVLDWQDGTTETIAGLAATQRDHVYSAPGTFNVTLTSAGTAPVVVPVTVVIPAPTATVDSNALAVTLNLGTLLSGNAYQIDWGDGSSESLTPTASTAVLTHTYSRPGSYAVKISTAGAAPVTVTALVRASSPVLSVTPAAVNYTVQVQVGQPVTATLTNLVPALTYQLNWQDGSVDTVTGVTTATRTHVYLKEGYFGINGEQADGYTSNGFQVIVTLPAPAFTTTAEQLDATATLTELIPVVTYTFDWADGTPPVTVTGVTTATLTHHYAAPGDYRLFLKANDRIGVRQTLSVQVSPATLTVTATGLQATATITGMQPELSYTLDWTDGATETITGVTTATRSHTYLLPYTYTVTVTAPRVPAASANVTTVATAPVLKVSATNLSATAEVNGLLPGVTYLFEWGDGEGQYLTNQLDVTLTHVYRAPGAYTVKVDQQPYGIKVPGVIGATAPLTVGLPPREVIQVTGHDELGGTTHFHLSGLLPEGPYLLDFGDGTNPERLTGSADASVDHTYGRSGTYTVTLTLQTYPGTIVRSTAVNTVKIALDFGNPIVVFGQSNDQYDLTLYANPVVAIAKLYYRGGGQLTGRWVIDGQSVENVNLTLPEALGNGAVQVKFTHTETKPGQHTLQFEVTAPKTLSSSPVRYRLDAPDTLDYNGFKVTVNSITRLSDFNGSTVTLSGTGTARLIVGGTQLSDVNVTFENQKVEENGAVREGSVTVDLNGVAVRNARLGDLKVGLSRLTLTQDGAALGGTVTLPGVSSSLSFTGAPLSADTGDLIAPLKAAVQNVKLPEDGLSFNATAAVLDLSGTQNPSELAAAYKQQAPQQNDWMGVVFPAASLTVGTPILSQPVTLTLPLAYNLSGYVTTLDLPAGKTNLLGWSVDLTSLRASVLAGRIGTTTGTGTVTLPLVNEPMDLKLGWNTNAKPGSRLTLSAGTAVKNHVFGKTSLTLGEGVWNTTPAGLTVTFANARWFLGPQGNDLAMSNLTMNGNGDLTLDGRAWTSITGNTALTVLDYPFAGAEVGVLRQGAAYILGLNGKLQINEKLPTASSNAKTLFWVQGGKDLKVTTEAQHLTGELAKVPYDINLTPAFSDQGRLEFTGTGTMRVAKLLNVDAKASFGRFTGTSYEYFKPNTSGSAGYGSVTASLAANPDLGKPLVSAKRVELYELTGGLTVNMDWPNGLDAPPVFREKGPNMVFEAAALLSVKQDPGTPVKPFMKGALSVDTSGTFNMKADLWLVKEGQKLVRNTPNGRALVSISDERTLVQACVGPNSSVGSGSVGGLDCRGLADLNLYDLMTLRGSLELYAPYSGSDQHLYIGTRDNPVVVRVPGYPEGNGYLMVDPSSVRAGAGVTWGFEKGNSGSFLVCSWYWNIKATATLNADFGIVYSPPALDGHVNFSANAAANAGGCGIGVSASAAMMFDGTLHVASAGNYFDGTVSANVSLPVIPNINFSVNTKVKF